MDSLNRRCFELWANRRSASSMRRRLLGFLRVNSTEFTDGLQDPNDLKRMQDLKVRVRHAIVHYELASAEYMTRFGVFEEPKRNARRR